MNNFLRDANLYLVGMMGSGKTTVGRLLAERLGYRFFDTDEVIEQVVGQSISQIFATLGEAEFRQVESLVLAKLVEESPRRSIVATGGGMVLRRENWQYLRYGVVVWLDVPVAQIQARLVGDSSRPLLQNADLATKLQTLWEQRQALYAQADVRVTAVPDETPDQFAMRLLAQVQQAVTPDRSTNNGAIA